jgi:CRISPR/Cas system-associated protein Cas10 (large subunit of type III CRISPR-Cas system)
VIGVMVKTNRHTTLSVLEKTVERLPALENKLFRVVNMESGNIQCGHCGRINTWHFSQRRMEEMLERHISRTFGLEKETVA